MTRLPHLSFVAYVCDYSLLTQCRRILFLWNLFFGLYCTPLSLLTLSFNKFLLRRNSACCCGGVGVGQKPKTLFFVFFTIIMTGERQMFG